MTRILAGTCGFAYRAWTGSFYPPGVRGPAMLAAYAERLPTVEIDATFYGPPDPEVLARWHDATPPGFLFSVKAPREITHERRLVDVGAPVRAFQLATAELEEKLGTVLFQLPPNLPKDLRLLRALLALVPRGGRTAIEPRHASWRDDAVYAELREAGVALCIADAREGETELVSTARFGYLRLRRRSYTRRALARWVARIRAQGWDEAFVYFMNPEGATAPRLAETLARAAGAYAPSP